MSPWELALFIAILSWLGRAQGPLPRVKYYPMGSDIFRMYAAQSGRAPKDPLTLNDHITLAQKLPLTLDDPFAACEGLAWAERVSSHPCSSQSRAVRAAIADALPRLILVCTTREQVETTITTFYRTCSPTEGNYGP